MHIGIVGLGRMGSNIATRLLQSGHEVVAFDIDPAAVQASVDKGATAAVDLAALVVALPPPRAVWVMLPAGPITQTTIDELAESLESGDVVIDGGNSRYTETLSRSTALAAKGISLVDVGTSGGIWGLSAGFCLMVGAERDVFRRLEDVFAALAPAEGYAHVGPPGSGHFTKMVHNGIEYALVQAYGEGFELLNNSDFDLDLTQIAEVWRNGSVIRSWLLDLIARALAADPDLSTITDYVEDSGEGRWTVETAIDQGVPTPTIALSLFARFASRQDESFSSKMIAALRREFGGHAVVEKEQ